MTLDLTMIFAYDTKTLAKKSKNKRMGYATLKNFYASKDTINRVKGIL